MIRPVAVAAIAAAATVAFPSSAAAMSEREIMRSKWLVTSVQGSYKFDDVASDGFGIREIHETGRWTGEDVRDTVIGVHPRRMYLTVRGHGAGRSLETNGVTTTCTDSYRYDWQRSPYLNGGALEVRMTARGRVTLKAAPKPDVDQLGPCSKSLFEEGDNPWKGTGKLTVRGRKWTFTASGTSSVDRSELTNAGTRTISATWRLTVRGVRKRLG